MSPDGRSTVVWTGGDDDGWRRLWGRQFGADGRPIGPIRKITTGSAKVTDRELASNRYDHIIAAFTLTPYNQAPRIVYARGAAAPFVRITGGPRGKTRKRGAKFLLRAEEPGSAFSCKLDTGRWVPCRSPYRIRKLKPGKHVLRVRASPAAVTGPAAVRNWRVLRS